MTVTPETPDGTANVQLNVPVAVHALADPIVPPEVIVNVMVELAVNPLPDAVTTTPPGPCVGTSVTDGSVIPGVGSMLCTREPDPGYCTPADRPHRDSCGGEHDRHLRVLVRSP